MLEVVLFDQPHLLTVPDGSIRSYQAVSREIPEFIMDTLINFCREVVPILVVG